MIMILLFMMLTLLLNSLSQKKGPLYFENKKILSDQQMFSTVTQIHRVDHLHILETVRALKQILEDYSPFKTKRCF